MVFFFTKTENPQSYEEMVEVLMIELRKLCELKQQDHSHISDPNKPHFNKEVGLLISDPNKPHLN